MYTLKDRNFNTTPKLFIAAIGVNKEEKRKIKKKIKNKKTKKKKINIKINES